MIALTSDCLAADHAGCAGYQLDDTGEAVASFCPCGCHNRPWADLEDEESDE